jgi:hypothetical protein
MDDLDDTPEAMALNSAHARAILAAAAQPGFSGELRRAINAALVPSHRLAADIGVTVDVLEDFRAGTVDLPGGAIDRLVARLGLRLTPVETTQDNW